MSPRRERGRGRGSTRYFRLLFFGWSVSPATLLIAGRQRKGVINLFQTLRQRQAKRKGLGKGGG